MEGKRQEGKMEGRKEEGKELKGREGGRERRIMKVNEGIERKGVCAGGKER